MLAVKYCYGYETGKQGQEGKLVNGERSIETWGVRSKEEDVVKGSD